VSRNPWWAAGVITGALIGAAVVLLYAPSSGKSTLAAIRRHLRGAGQEAREAGMRAEAEILTRYQQVRSASLATRPGPDSLSPVVA
jgi:gas vesicle protein